jgi:hypothetical protein
MSANVFNSQDAHDIVERINQLNEQNARKWGTMTLPEMLTHCNIQLKMALGQLPESPPEGPAYFHTAFGKWVILYGFPWPKGTVTPSAMNMTINGVEAHTFTEEKTELLALLQEALQRDHFNAHPFIGALNKQEWGRMIWKHLDHHLRQFGG